MHSKTQQAWWRHAVVYQVYIRSFADGSGDGTGDIAGLRNRLGHLADLGVDAIWINPWYASPLKDGGYDVSDYRRIASQFGTTDEAEQLLTEAHDRGIRVIVDLVPNHTSDEHEWFQAALEAGPDSAERARYLFRDGKGADGSEPPTNWTAVFGGPAWEQVDDGEWYLHLFDTSQPDLDWENPEVRAEFVDIFRFWLERGVDGFRVDVAHGLVKDQTFPDLEVNPELLGGATTGDHPYWDRDGVHEIIREWRTVLDEYDDRMMVAEAWVRPHRVPLYLRPDEYHQSFNFALVEASWDPKSFAQVIETSVSEVSGIGATTTWVLSNHDVMRHASRYGLAPGANWRHWGPASPVSPDLELGLRRARAAVMITMSLPGAVYVYQGEELGLPEVIDLPVEVLDDPVWERSEHTENGRDGCRVPIPWEVDGPSFGFGDSEPWLPQPDFFGKMSVEAQAGDPDSMLELYRAAIGLRNGTFSGEGIELLDLGPNVLAYRRENDATCVVNMGAKPIELPDGRVVLTSAPLEAGLLPTDTAAWIAAT
ncbi:MAG: glycoside hydrolase family 13 protein [Acidimicrobiales bacterium]